MITNRLYKVTICSLCGEKFVLSTTKYEDSIKPKCPQCELREAWEKGFCKKEENND